MPDCLLRPCPDPASDAPARPGRDADRHARFLGELARLRQESDKAGYSPYAGLLLDQALLLFTHEYEQRHPREAAAGADGK